MRESNLKNKIINGDSLEELKKIVRSYIKKSIGLKPLTYIEIIRI